MTDPLLESLKRVDPVDLDEVRNRPLRREAIAEMTATPRGAEPRSRLPARRLLPVVAVAAVAIAIAVAVLPSSPDQASPQATRVLESMAGIASAQAASPSGYAYTRLVNVGTSTTATIDSNGDASGFTQYLRTTIEQWSAADGSGRVVAIQHRPEFPGPRDERRWRASDLGPLPDPRTTDERFGAGELDRSPPGASGLPRLSDLPTDPSALADVLARVAHESEEVPVEAKTFEIAAAALMEAGASPALRAALYECVSEIDGVDFAGKARDPLGRIGTAVSIDSAYSGALTREKLIFDSDNSQPLAYVSELLVPQPWIDGRLRGYTVVEASGHADDMRERP